MNVVIAKVYPVSKRIPMALPNLNALTRSELAETLENHQQPKFRTDQVLDWLWKKRVRSIEEMSNLPAKLREVLTEEFSMVPPSPVGVLKSSDTTQKALFKLKDGRYVESVLIPASQALYGEKSDRLTLCVSSQVGCAYGCKFCASGLAGFSRNLTPDEIAGQVVEVERATGQRVNNMVFMGMGEPLANINNLLKALELITQPWGIGIGARHLTISTSGLVPQIKKLADHPQQIRLAISLHGATDEVRNKIMPVNKKWGVDELFDALEYWNERKKQRLTLEYILIQGVNDSEKDAKTLASKAKRIQAKVNLIPYNTVEGLEWIRPSDERCRRFKSILTSAGVTATLRTEKGHDIEAACGQLRLKKETEEGIIT